MIITQGSKGTLEYALASVQSTMADMLSGALKEPIHLLASLAPGAGKTEALCSFLRSWKADYFSPAGGALIVLATHKEIQSCIDRAGLQPQDFAVLIQKGAALASLGSSDPEAAPILFTTREMLRRRCHGRSFTKTACYHYLGRPRALKIWDEAFMPAKEVTLRKHLIVQPLADLSVHDPAATHALEALGDSLSADRIGQAIHIIIHAQDRDSYSIVEELRALTVNPERLSWVHWGNHHGTNEYRHIRRVGDCGWKRGTSRT